MCAAPEVLEDRVVMSAGEGSTFAILPGTVGNVGQVSSVQFKIDPTLFTAPKGGKLLLGIDVAPATPASSTSTTTTASLKPEIVSITDSSGHVIPVQHSKYNAKVAKANKLGDTPTSAVLVDVKVPNKGQPDNDYSVQVKGLELTTGQYLVGFYLPGDVAGTGTVTQADLQTIKKDKGLTAMNSKYSFDADVNRDGVINHQDYADGEKRPGSIHAGQPGGFGQPRPRVRPSRGPDDALQHGRLQRLSSLPMPRSRSSITAVVSRRLRRLTPRVRIPSLFHS